MRLIDVDRLLHRAIPHGWSTKWVSDIMIDDAPTIDAVPREEHEAIVYAREQIAYNRGLTDGRKEQLMTSGYVTTSTDEPPVVYAEQKRGKWKEDIGGFSCTVCGYHTDDDEIGNWDIAFGRWKYCPSCGAMMDEDNRKEQYGEIHQGE